MNDQLKAFLCSLLYQLVNYRTQSRDLRGDYRDWANWGRISGRIDLAAELGLLTHDQWVDLHRLLSSASDCLGKPFPHPANAGPVMPWRVLHLRRQAAVAAKPAVIHMGGYDFVDASQAKPQAQDSSNDRSCAVSPAPAASQGLRLPELLCPQSAGQDVRLSPSPARRQLRLLCVLVKTKLGTAQAGCLPIHTMHRVPPRSMVQGKWSNPRYAGLYLRETQAVAPSTEVLARCERHRQTHALRAPARTVRTGGVSA